MRKQRLLKRTLLVASLASVLPSIACAEDIDLFVGGAATVTGNNPNVLIILDNSTNWNSNNQHWIGANGENPYKQGQSELRALHTVALEATDQLNLGLMMFRPGGGTNLDGAYIRYAVRTMDAPNKANLADLIGTSSCVDGTAANGTPKCIFKNFSTNNPEMINVGNIDYGAAMFEAFKYFGGCTSPANAQSSVCKSGSDLARNKFGKQRYHGAANISGSDGRIFDQAAYTDGSMTSYIPPAGTANSCAKNYVVIIGNSFPKDDIAISPLANVEGQTAQLSMPQFNTVKDKIIGTQCGTGNTAAQRKANCEAAIPAALKTANPAQTYACINERVDAGCTGGGPNPRLFDVQAINLDVWTVVATGESAVPPANKARMGDEWARYLYTTDVGEAAGFQNVITYTIDVFKDQQDQDQTGLLFSMAKYGGGRYFQAKTEQQILDALRDILIEIQSVNTVFASASLPINATNRSQNENQVFIGMFRPDAGARPRWYGNLKRYQIAKFGQDFKLADASTPPLEAVSTATGFIAPCARSFWTTDTTSFNKLTAPPTDTSYWNFSDPTGTHIGTCTTSTTTSLFSDLPDGPQVEKGATAQVVRLGNNPSGTSDFLEHRNVYSCRNTGAISCNTAPTTMHTFNDTVIDQAATGAFDSIEHADIINFTRGLDVWDENSRLSNTDVRPTVHGDVAHSRPLPVNYGGTTGVVLYYGANDGSFRAVSGNTGQELWAFVAPEHHGKLKRLYENGIFGTGLISYPPTPAIGSTAKDYFFDGSAGLFQNADDSRIWVFPSMRRGGRMLYAFDVTNPSAPLMKWRVGCTNADLTNTSSCVDATGAGSTLFEQMGQTWSTPTVARIRGYSGDPNRPVVIIGGGYDTCDDQDVKPNTACSTPYVRRGNRVFVLDGDSGALIAAFPTDASVPADVTVIDRNFDGLVDHAYVADTAGGIYRIDFVTPADPNVALAPASWTITKIGQTNSADARKFLFSPAALPTSGKVYLALASGDRERPLITNYPFPVTSSAGVMNRAYVLVDNFATTGLPVNLDDTTVMQDFSSGSTCTTPSAEASGKKGWYINLNAASTTGPTTNMGEQGVTSSLIFGGLIFFSTNRPVPTPPGACAQNLGEARGYALNLLNASGAADTLNICGGSRSQTFVGGGLPPSPVTGTVPVGDQMVTVMIGGVQRGGGASTSIGAQRVAPAVTQRRARLYWYTDGDK